MTSGFNFLVDIIQLGTRSLWSVDKVIVIHYSYAWPNSVIICFLEFVDPHLDEAIAINEKITEPIILWWTGFTREPGKYEKCGQYKCFFTIDKHYYHHPQTKVSVTVNPYIYDYTRHMQGHSKNM